MRRSSTSCRPSASGRSATSPSTSSAWGSPTSTRWTRAGCLEGAGPEEFERTVDVYYGPQGSHDLLERTTWHCGQHLRQLYVLADRLKLAPGPLPTHLFKDLPIPDSI